jgi:2,4-dienoyl-CoA reductase-like NADH-dependent reductase (Old Yellow Enzyme family)
MSSTSPPFPSLFSPWHIGDLEIKNRIVSSGHDTVMVDDGHVTDQLVAYHRARAAGGVGLIVVQVSGVHETARYTSHVLMATDDSCIAGYRRLADAVMPFDTAIFGQLFHPGREVMDATSEGTLQVAVAPSSIPNERFHVMPRALSTAEVAEIIDGYASAARRLMDAGFHGAEIVMSHGYLPSQFLNPLTNVRSDRYGGDEENRLRFLLEVLAAVRAATRDEFVLGARISLDEHDPGGLPSEIACAAIVRAADEELLDYVSVTTGTSATLAGSDHIAPDMSFENAYVAIESGALRSMVSIPVIVAGRINQPQEAERVVVSGAADACVMTRALICDPEMPKLAAQGRTEDIRACIGCNQACIGHFHQGFPISCIQHPETGREERYGVVIQATASKRVLVVGGGPAGMKAAAIAAERGHRVSLHEGSGRLGGQILLAERLIGREEFGGAAINLARELERSGADVHLNSWVDRLLIDEQDPDLVVVATGARPFRPPLEVMGDPAIADAWEVLEGRELPRGHVVVIDWRGDWIGSGIARLLRARGHVVTLASNAYAPASALQQYVRDSHLRALVEANVTLLPLVRLFGVDDDTAYLQHLLTDEPILIEGISGVVLAHAHEPVDDLLREIEASSVRCIGIGDCMAPRTMEEAVLEGLRAGSEI